MPAFVTIASNAINREVGWKLLFLPMAITTFGLLIVNFQSLESLTSLGSKAVFLATILSLMACVLWAYFVVVNGLILKQQAKKIIDNSVWTALIGIGAFLASFLLLPFADQGTGSIPSFEEGTMVRYLVTVVAIAILGSWYASWSWNKATKTLSTAILGQLIALETVFGLIFNLMWEMRFPSLVEVTGASFVFIGVVLCLRVFEQARIERRLVDA